MSRALTARKDVPHNSFDNSLTRFILSSVKLVVYTQTLKILSAESLDEAEGRELICITLLLFHQSFDLPQSSDLPVEPVFSV